MSIINTNNTNNTNINININTDINTDINTNTGINTEINTGINTDTNIDINTDTVKLDTGYKKVWLNNYPACVPAHLKYDVYTSLNHLLDTVYHQYQNRVAYTCMGTDLTYAQLDAQSKAIAAWLLAQGLKHGERVAIMLPNILQYPCVTAGILRAGMVCVNTNPLYTARELKHQLQDSGAKAIFVLDNFAHVLQTVLPETAIHTVVTTSLGDGLSWWKGLLVNLTLRHIKRVVPAFHIPHAVSFKTMHEQAQHLTYTPAATTMQDLAFLQYTGGTTGISKGAALTHQNIVANTLQVGAWMQPKLQTLPPEHQLVVVCALPLYHIFALTVCNMMAAQLGAMSILIPNPKDIGSLIQTLKPYRINMFPGVNTLFNALINHPKFSTLDFSQLLISNGGGMAVTHATAEKWFQITGCPIAEGYGLSETSPVVCSNLPTITEFSGTIGLPFPDTHLIICDEQGVEVAQGMMGEICIKGPQVMQGYWNRPDETAKAMYPDGFFRSGDMGVMDEQGYFKIVDRIKNMILVSGFNVYPSEIEAVISLHPQVLECAAIAMPDAHCGEVPRVYVVIKTSFQNTRPAPTEAEILTFAAKSLTNYKRPKSVVFVKDLPKNNVGKILHRELRQQALQGLQAK